MNGQSWLRLEPFDALVYSPKHGAEIRFQGNSSNDRTWPGPGIPGVCHRLTVADRVAAPKVSSMPPPRTHAAGQERASKNFPESRRSTSGPYHL